MSVPTVETILHEIEELSEEERLQLQAILDDRAEQDWQQAAESAQQAAARQGLDQSLIDAAIERVRYGA